MPVKRNARHRVEANDFVQYKHPRAVAISPDGKLIAFTLSVCDAEKKKYFSHLHVMDTQTGATRQWTFGEFSERGLAWSQDGTRLAFLRFEKGEDRIYAISREGGEAELLLKKLGSFGGVKWAENDSSLVVKFRKNDPDEEAEKAAKDGKTPESKTPASRRISRLFYRLDGEGFLPEDRYHLYRFDLKTKAFDQLTKGKADDEAFAVSPDGQKVAYVANVSDDPDMHPFHKELYLLDLKTRKRKLLDPPLGEKLELAFSPNGKYLVYFGHHNLHDAWGVEPVHPYLIELKTGKQKNLTPKFDRQPMDLTIGDIGYGLDTINARWSADSRSFYYLVSDEGDTYIARARISQGDPERIWKLHGQVPAFDLVGNSMVAIHTGYSSLGDLHWCKDIRSSKFEFQQVTDFNQAYFRKTTLGRIREVRFRSGDGTKLHGWLMTPPDFSLRKKYPAIVEVHGGPRTQYGRVFFHEMQYLAAQGFVVFYMNPRGSQGYGEKFAGSIVAAWGTCDYDDVMAATDWLEQQNFVDSKRIGITGGSYGGYMTNLAVGKTRRFRAAVTQRSVVDLKTFVGSSDIGFLDSYEFGGHYWDNPEGYAKMSPLTYADKVRTPLLIIHSENDMRCAIEQGEQLFAALKIRGRTVEMLRFPEESHGLSRGGRPDRRVIRLEAIAGWFKKYMKK